MTWLYLLYTAGRRVTSFCFGSWPAFPLVLREPRGGMRSWYASSWREKKHPVSYVIKANLIGHKKLQRCATKVLTCKQDMCVGWGDQYSWDIYWGGQLLQQAVGWLRPGSQSPSLQQLTIMWVIYMTIPVTNFCLYSWSFSHCYYTEIQYVATICTDLCNLINCYYFENMFPEVKCDFR